MDEWMGNSVNKATLGERGLILLFCKCVVLALWCFGIVHFKIVHFKWFEHSCCCDRANCGE